ncbi:MAG: hypothetical protein NTV81_02080, partial [Candidatus Komeilibacteria bacterium]|nr:hypothetical protein [Candidatus Komeilibacteria bacterium]
MKIIFQKNKSSSINIALVEIVKNSEETQVVLLPSGQKIIQLGVKESKKINCRRLITLIRQIIILVKANKIKQLAIEVNQLVFGSLKLSDLELGQILAQETLLANFEFNQYKTKPAKGWSQVEELVLVGQVSIGFKKGVERGLIIGQEINDCRTLANMPGSLMTPTILAEAAKTAASKSKIKFSVLGVAEMKKLKMNAILGVAQGSAEKPKFIIMEYWGAIKSQKPLVLVGKGVTFDAGGLNVKPGDSMYEMHMDMSGGSAVIHAISAAAKLKVKKNIIA